MLECVRDYQCCSSPQHDVGADLLCFIISVHRRDFSKATNQFNLRKHLMAPTPRDHRDGIENSRRLAHNAIRLGIDDEKHREVSIVSLKSKCFMNIDVTYSHIHMSLIT